jgi:hypothetical protein
MESPAAMRRHVFEFGKVADARHAPEASKTGTSGCRFANHVEKGARQSEGTQELRAQVARTVRNRKVMGKKNGAKAFPLSPRHDRLSTLDAALEERSGTPSARGWEIGRSSESRGASGVRRVRFKSMDVSERTEGYG